MSALHSILLTDDEVCVRLSYVTMAAVLLLRKQVLSRH